MESDHRKVEKSLVVEPQRKMASEHEETMKTKRARYAHHVDKRALRSINILACLLDDDERELEDTTIPSHSESILRDLGFFTAAAITSTEIHRRFVGLYHNLLEKLRQVRSIKEEDARGFPGPDVLESFKPQIDEIAALCGVDPFGEILPRAFAHGYSARMGSTHLDFILDIAQRLKSTSPLQADKLLDLVLEFDPNCVRALCEQARDRPDDIRLLARIVQAGNAQEKDVSTYEYALAERTGPARNLQHALKLAYFQNFQKLQNENPDAIIEYNTKVNEVQVLVSNEAALKPTETLVIDHYSVKIVYLKNAVKPLYARPHSPTISGGNLLVVRKSDAEWYIGTLGCVVRTVVGASECLVSNGHVLSRSLETFAKNFEVAHKFAEDDDYEIIATAEEGAIVPDIAIASISPKFSPRLDTTTIPVHSLIPNQQFLESILAQSSLECFKFGGASGLTTAYVACMLQHRKGREFACDIVVDTHNPQWPFAEEGDSGSFVFAKIESKTYLIGILWGKYDAPTSADSSASYRVHAVFSWLDYIKLLVQDSVSANARLRINSKYAKE